MEENKTLKDAVLKYGRDAQMDIVVEECSELIKAIMKFKRYGSHNLDTELHLGLIRDICEEIADVDIMIDQLKMIFSRQLIEEYKIEKIERLRKRMLS